MTRQQNSPGNGSSRIQDENKELTYRRDIHDLLRLCPIENLYQAQDQVLALFSVSRNRPFEICPMVLPPLRAITFRKDGDDGKKAFQFREKIYESLIESRDWDSTDKEFFAQFLHMGKSTYKKLLADAKGSNLSELKESIDKHPNLRLLLGTCMDLNTLFSCSLTEEENFYLPDGETPFWDAVYRKVGDLMGDCVELAKSAGKLAEAELWFEHTREHLRCLLFHPKDYRGLRGWYVSWKDILRLSQNAYATKLYIRINSAHIQRRMHVLGELLENWDSFTEQYDKQYNSQLLENAFSLYEQHYEAHRKTELLRQKGGLKQDQVQEVLEKEERLADSSLKMAETQMEQYLESYLEPYLDLALQKWLPDYNTVKDEIAENGRYTPVREKIEAKRHEYEKTGREFLKNFLEYWLEFHPKAKESIYNDRLPNLRLCAEKKEEEKEIEIKKEENDSRRELDFLNGALKKLLDMAIRKTRPEGHMYIGPAAARQIAENADESLCFYLGLINERILAEVPKLMDRFLEEELMKKYAVKKN